MYCYITYYLKNILLVISYVFDEVLRWVSDWNYVHTLLRSD